MSLYSDRYSSAFDWFCNCDQRRLCCIFSGFSLSQGVRPGSFGGEEALVFWRERVDLCLCFGEVIKFRRQRFQLSLAGAFFVEGLSLCRDGFQFFAKVG